VFVSNGGKIDPQIDFRSGNADLCHHVRIYEPIKSDLDLRRKILRVNLPTSVHFHLYCSFKRNMEYEIYLGCNIVGALAVALIFAYHLITSQPIKSFEPAEPVDNHVSTKSKKQQ